MGSPGGIASVKIHILRKGQTYGPYDRESIEGFLKEGLVSGGDLAWALGQEGWIPLGELLGLTSEPTVEQDSEGEQSEEHSDPELAETVEKIKTLLDEEEEEFALDLVRSLNEPKLFAELLRDCSIGQDGVDQGKPMLPDWLYQEHFFLFLLSHCPEEAKIDASLRSENLTHLNIQECSSLTNVDFLSEFTNLMHLSLAGGKSLTNLDCLSDLKGLRFLSLCECESLPNIDFLAGLTNLTELELSWCSLLTNVDALSGLTNLEILYLNDCKSLKNVDGLSGLTNLRRLNLVGTFLEDDQVDELRTALPDCEIFEQ